MGGVDSKIDSEKERHRKRERERERERERDGHMDISIERKRDNSWFRRNEKIKDSMKMLIL